MVHSKIQNKYNIDWDEIIEQCDYNGDGVIDFQEFMSACIDRKVLQNEEDVDCSDQYSRFGFTENLDRQQQSLHHVLGAAFMVPLVFGCIGIELCCVFCSVARF